MRELLRPPGLTAEDEGVADLCEGRGGRSVIALLNVFNTLNEGKWLLTNLKLIAL
jgi:hypothetical protein